MALEFITMGQSEARAWASEVAARVGKNIQRARKGASMSAQDLSNACEASGYPIPRSTIANIETGRKEAVVLQELLVIAGVLGVPAMTLIYFPDDAGVDVQFLPGKRVLSVDAARDFTSDRAVPPSDLARRQANVESLRKFEERAAFYLKSSREVLAGNSESAWWMDRNDLSMARDTPGSGDDLARQESEQLASMALPAIRRATRIREWLTESGVSLWEIPTELLSAYSTVAAELAAQVNGSD